MELETNKELKFARTNDGATHIIVLNLYPLCQLFQKERQPIAYFVEVEQPFQITCTDCKKRIHEKYETYLDTKGNFPIIKTLLNLFSTHNFDRWLNLSSQRGNKTITLTKRQRRKYHHGSVTKTPSGRHTFDINDCIAKTLRGRPIDIVREMASPYLKSSTQELEDKYCHLNPGLQRMSIGNRLRAILRNNKQLEDKWRQDYEQQN